MIEFTTVRLCRLLQEKGPLNTHDIMRGLNLNHTQAKRTVHNMCSERCIAPEPKVKGQPVTYRFVCMPRPATHRPKPDVSYAGRKKKIKPEGSGVIPQHRYMPSGFRVLRRGDIQERAQLCMLAR